MSTATEILPEIQEDLTEPDGKAHIVRIDSLLKGGAVVALCGKKYVPTVVGQEVFDREQCKPCADLFEIIKSMDL